MSATPWLVAGLIVVIALIFGRIAAQLEEPAPAASFEPDLPFPGYGLSPEWPNPAPGTSDPLPDGAALPLAGARDGGQWDNQILYACAVLDMPDPLAPLLVKAIIQHESGFQELICGDAFPGRCGLYRDDARMHRGGVPCCSIGLMQVYRPAHSDLATNYDLRDGNQNILAGCQVLAGAYRDHWPDWNVVLQTYNGGSTRNAQTRAYASSVGATFRRLAASRGVIV